MLENLADFPACAGVIRPKTTLGAVQVFKKEIEQMQVRLFQQSTQSMCATFDHCTDLNRLKLARHLMMSRQRLTIMPKTFTLTVVAGHSGVHAGAGRQPKYKCRGPRTTCTSAGRSCRGPSGASSPIKAACLSSRRWRRLRRRWLRRRWLRRRRCQQQRLLLAGTIIAAMTRVECFVAAAVAAASATAQEH